MSKRCNTCGVAKHEDEFSLAGKGNRRATCRECHRAKVRASAGYAARKAAMREARKATKREPARVKRAGQLLRPLSPDAAAYWRERVGE